MSYKFGDDTAYMLGRVTLNPVKHTDPIGTLLIPTLAFVLGAMGGGLGRIPLDRLGKTDARKSAKMDKLQNGERNGLDRRCIGKSDLADDRHNCREDHDDAGLSGITISLVREA